MKPLLIMENLVCLLKTCIVNKNEYVSFLKKNPDPRPLP